jgi:glutaredoxin
MLNGEMLSGLTGKLCSLAHQQLEAHEADGPLVRRLRDVVSTVNDLLGKPIRPDDLRGDSATGGGPVIVTPVVREQAPVVVYFDGKDQRTKTKIEELLNARDVKFTLLDVTNDEAERSWVITAAKSEEFPIVVIAGTPVGGFHELMQLDVTGGLKKRVFGS